MIGTGVFALSRTGRERFNLFPDIIADDGFIRAMFKKEERVSVANCYSMVCSKSRPGVDLADMNWLKDFQS